MRLLSPKCIWAVMLIYLISLEVNMNSVFEKVDLAASSIIETDLDSWVVPELFQSLTSRIDQLSHRAYGQQDEGSSVAILSFRERAKVEIKAAANTYIFKHKHWQDNKRSIGPYVLRTLSNLADRIYWENHYAKKANLPICPGCRELNRKEFLSQEGKLWRCGNCTSEMSRIQEEIKSIKILNDPKNRSMLATLEARLKLFSSFALHTRKGYKCPDCFRFIPESENRKFGIACPYDNCLFFGDIEDMEVMIHPLGLGQRITISLNKELGDSGDSFTLQDTFAADIVSADVQLAIEELNQEEFKTMIQVIEDQVAQIKRTNSQSTLAQKLLMYEAFKNMAYKYPEEMVSYLVHEKQNPEWPLQVRIFQDYVSMMENYLPFTIEKKGQKIDIVELTDPDLGLFEGKSTFEAEVESGYIIPNLTKETYTGGREFKHYGPCYIGRLINVVNSQTKESLMSKVLGYTFVDIKMDKSVPIGTPVTVTHFRILSHYEIAHLVFLQRIRRHLVDSIYFRLHKKKRPVGKGG